MPEYRVTFGSRYRYDPYPNQDALDFVPHPNGWVCIEAENEPQARLAAFALLDQAWAFLYAPPFVNDGPPSGRWDQLYPGGELARYTAAELLERAQT